MILKTIIRVHGNLESYAGTQKSVTLDLTEDEAINRMVDQGWQILEIIPLFQNGVYADCIYLGTDENGESSSLDEEDEYDNFNDLVGGLNIGNE